MFCLFIMQIFQLVHMINSPVLKRKLEKHLSGFSEILSYETEDGWHTYEIQIRTRKKEFIRSLKTFIQNLSLDKEERVVLYDTKIWPKLPELTGKNEKIILNGDIEKENHVEEIILEIFGYIQMKMELNEIEKNILSH